VPREIEPEELTVVLRELSYPAFRPDAAAALSDVTVLDGDEALNLGSIVSRTGRDAYRDPDELLAAVTSRLESSDLPDGEDRSPTP